MNLKNMPKIELHVHLDGSVSVKTAFRILKRKPDMIANHCQNLEEYLTKFEEPILIMQEKENLKLVAKQLGLDLIKDHVIYAEIRFCPLLHTNHLTMNEVIDSVLMGLTETNISFNLILCMMRHFSLDDNKKIVDKALEYLDKGVCAVDLAGSEGGYPTSSFGELFEYVKNKGIPYTIHAGEVAGVDSIMSAISFGTKRLGHGIRCIEDEKLMDIIKKNNITLEVCPTSNIDTKAVDNYHHHPIRQLYDCGIRVTINTDNRTVSNITLAKEYKKLRKYLKFNKKDFIKMNEYAIDASFSSDKESLLKQIRQ